MQEQSQDYPDNRDQTVEPQQTPQSNGPSELNDNRQPITEQTSETVEPAVFRSQYVGGDLSKPEVTDEQSSTEHKSIRWQASEYINHEKSIIWFVGLATATAVLMALAIFLIQDYMFALVVIVMSIAVVVVGRRPAHEIEYELTYEGLSVNGKFFSFHNYRAFGVIPEGAVYSVSIIPNKRFSPSLNVYFPADYGEQIVDMLGAALPMEDIKLDFIDNLTKKLHF